MSMISQNTAMLAATRGVKSNPVGVIEFMPTESLPWVKRKAGRKEGGITDGKMQHLIIKQSFGFFS